jgi:hypothetical protein
MSTLDVRLSGLVEGCDRFVQGAKLSGERLLGALEEGEHPACSGDSLGRLCMHLLGRGPVLAVLSQTCPAEGCDVDAQLSHDTLEVPQPLRNLAELPLRSSPTDFGAVDLTSSRAQDAAELSSTGRSGAEVGQFVPGVGRGEDRLLRASAWGAHVTIPA